MNGSVEGAPALLSASDQGWVGLGSPHRHTHTHVCVHCRISHLQAEVQAHLYFDIFLQHLLVCVRVFLLVCELVASNEVNLLCGAKTSVCLYLCYMARGLCSSLNTTFTFSPLQLSLNIYPFICNRCFFCLWKKNPRRKNKWFVTKHIFTWDDVNESLKCVKVQNFISAIFVLLFCFWLWDFVLHHLGILIDLRNNINSFWNHTFLWIDFKKWEEFLRSSLFSCWFCLRNCQVHTSTNNLYHMKSSLHREVGFCFSQHVFL